MTNTKYCDDIYASPTDLLAEKNLPNGVHRRIMYALSGAEYYLIHVVVMVRDGNYYLCYEGRGQQSAVAAEMQAEIEWRAAQRRDEAAEQP